MTNTTTPPKKIYEVFIQDEYNNNWLMGFYPSLNSALPDVNNFLTVYNVYIEDLEEYPSTFSSCFDKEIIAPDETYLMVRGFILDPEYLQSVINV